MAIVISIVMTVGRSLTAHNGGILACVWGVGYREGSPDKVASLVSPIGH